MTAQNLPLRYSLRVRGAHGPAASRFLLASLLAAVALSSTLVQAQELVVQDAPVIKSNQDTIIPTFEQLPQDKAVWPMVDVDRQQNKSTVDVHVPIFFDMTNHKDAESGRNKLDLSVLQGLVTVNKDRGPDQSGHMSGPVKVTVFGIPVYQGKSLGASHDSDNSISQTRSSLSDRGYQASEKLNTNVRQTNEKLLTGLSDFLGRLTSMVRQASQAVTSPSGSYLQPAREERQQQLQPQPYLELQNQRAQQTQAQAQALTRAEGNQIERMPIRSARDEVL